MKYKNGPTIPNMFLKNLDQAKCKLNKTWVEKSREFYNRSMKSWYRNDIETHSTHNEGKSVAERFIITLKNNIYKYLTSVSKNINIDKLDDIVNKCNNTYNKIKNKKKIKFILSFLLWTVDSLAIWFAKIICVITNEHNFPRYKICYGRLAR